MKTITKYACDVCLMEYRTEGEALACEKLPLPERTNNIEIGEEIPITMELDFAPGSTLTYKEVTGILLHRINAFNSKQGVHEQMLFCEVESDGVKQERGVILVNIENEGEKFFAPINYAYKPGFTKLMKENQI